MRRSGVDSEIRSWIGFIQRAEEEAETMRADLNHQIMFNLRDTYLAVARQQTALSLLHLAMFLGLPDTHLSLYRMLRWNNHGNSLNLSFAEFSALLVAKEDRLLAKMVVEREEMGAIPNFLLDQVRAILLKELEIHDFCMSCEIDPQLLTEWIESVIDENGDLSEQLLDEFMHRGQSSSSSRDHQLNPSSAFMRFLQTSGNISGERLQQLWQGGAKSRALNQDSSLKMHKLSTYITTSPSPKSLLASRSQQQLIRPEYYDCINRPPALPGEGREGRSIEKHLFRLKSDRNLRIIAKAKERGAKQERAQGRLVKTLKEIIQVQRQTENLRIELRLCPDFHPVLFFQTVSKDRSGSITPTTFRQYLQSFGHYVVSQEVYLLFRRYSWAGRMDFNSFCGMFDTVQREFDLLEKNRLVECLQDVHPATKKLFFQLIRAIISNENTVTKIKNSLLNRSKHLLEAVQGIFDGFGKDGILSEAELKEVFGNYLGIRVTTSDIRLILRRCGQGRPNGEPLSKTALLKELIGKT